MFETDLSSKRKSLGKLQPVKSGGNEDLFSVFRDK